MGGFGAGLGLGLGLGPGAALLGLCPALAGRSRRPSAAAEGGRAAAALARSSGSLLRPLEAEEAAALARAR